MASLDSTLEALVHHLDRIATALEARPLASGNTAPTPTPTPAPRIRKAKPAEGTLAEDVKAVEESKPAPPAPAEEEAAPPAPAEEEAAPPAPAEEEAAPPAPAVKVVETSAPAVLTLKAVTAKLSDLTQDDPSALDRIRTVLNMMGARRVSDLEEQDYEDFLTRVTG